MPATTPRPVRVLIVDPSEESRALLAELVRRGGASAIGAATLVEAEPLLRRDNPEVVVIDADAAPLATTESFVRRAGVTDATIVVSGTNRPVWAAELGCSFQRKPYHYRELLHKIWASRRAGSEPAKAAA